MAVGPAGGGGLTQLMKNYSVSVIIPNYNNARFLGQAIDSALAQTLPPREVIVVDDGSTDGSPQVLDGYGDRIRVIRQRNQGVAVARNTGAAIASGDLLAFLDSDDTWLPHKLERQVGRFAAEPTLGLVHGGYEVIDAAGAVLHRNVDGMEGWVAREMLLLRPAVVTSGSSIVIPRQVFEFVGGFDPDRHLRPSEDFDLCFRIADRFKVGFVPDVLMRYRQHCGNAHTDVASMERATLLIFEKIFRNPDQRLGHLRRSAYGNLHMVLAGSFFSAWRPLSFVKHALKSVWLKPANCSYLLGYPLRRWYNNIYIKY